MCSSVALLPIRALGVYRKSRNNSVECNPNDAITPMNKLLRTLYFQVSLVTVHFVMLVLIIIFDYSLYALQRYVRSAPDTVVTLTSNSSVQFQMTGTGIMKPLLKALHKGLELNRSRNFTYQPSTCFACPMEQSYTNSYFHILLLYTACLCWIFLSHTALARETGLGACLKAA